MFCNGVRRSISPITVLKVWFFRYSVTASRSTVPGPSNAWVRTWPFAFLHRPRQSDGSGIRSRNSYERSSQRRRAGIFQQFASSHENLPDRIFSRIAYSAPWGRRYVVGTKDNAHSVDRPKHLGQTCVAQHARMPMPKPDADKTNRLRRGP